MKKIPILFCLGTRPEAIKLAPVILLLKESPLFKVKICVTAQHREMLDQVLQIFKIEPDHDLNIMVEGQTLFHISREVLRGMEKFLDREQPELMIVQGDTTTAFIASLSAYYKKIKIAHIEAGLRSFDKHQPFPEEVNRRLLSHLADINFAPTPQAREHLRAENVPGDIYVTGNTVVDAMMEINRRKAGKLPVRIDPDKKMILVTVHRRENFGAPIIRIFSAIKKIAVKNPDSDIIYPVHPNPNVRFVAHRMLKGVKNIHLIEPLDYLNFVRLMARAYFILTDSGGIQEEAPTFHKPVLVLREKTERMEAIEHKIAKLLGSNTERIVREAQILLTSRVAYDRMSHQKNPFGDGRAAMRIRNYLLFHFRFRRKKSSEFGY